MRDSAVRTALLPLACLFAMGCATPVGIHPKNAREVREDLTRSVLSSEQPSPYTMQVLQRIGQRERYHQAPDEALGEIREGIVWAYPDDRLFALAELTFLRAQRSWLYRDRQRALYLAAAAYAYAFLFPEDTRGEARGAFDPRVRLASDLYNRALAEGLVDDATGGIALADGARQLPGAVLSIDFDESTLEWAGYQLTDFRDAAKIGVRGLINRYRHPGIGAPLVASTEPLPDKPDADHARVPPSIKVPVTALLRFENARAGLREGRLHARLELFAADVDPSIEIEGQAVPLEYENSSALAATLSNELIWSFELQGFFRGDLIPVAERSAGEGLLLLHPYQAGKVPVVFVHGTASSPGRWADLVNELSNVPVLRERFQPWLFIYNTGQPILYSASLLRQALQGAVADLDPDGSDPALRRMVVIGHSQGGLLTRLVISSSGDRFWQLVSTKATLDELDLDEDARGLLRAALFFEPLSFIDRVVFMCTPHRGSYLATYKLSFWLRRFIQAPGRVSGTIAALIARNPGALAVRSLRSVPSSLDNMTPNHPFLRTLAEAPMSPAVHRHSIVAVQTPGPVEQGNDGVVEYVSAHLQDVESEKVVRSAHSAQSNPQTMIEVGRILLEHLRAGDPEFDLSLR